MATHPHAKGLTYIDPAIVDTMKVLATGQTDAALNERFGISYNSWRKLLAGQPVRHSLAARLTTRLADIDTSTNGRSA